ncbi:translation initiation factor eIF2B subunit beta-like [Ornithodoros turicata]|uniref:translation initiation factor eIF2B subunit beta-like n=1 Tax=Ornithodoros turicata TaxID=34597 RepID=UPI00313A4A8A
MPETPEDFVQTLSMNLKQDKFETSNDIAKFLVNVLVNLIKHREWKTAQDLLCILRSEGQKMIKVDPTETAIGNIVRRILKIVRDDYISVECGRQIEGDSDSLQKMLLSQEDTVGTYTKHFPNLKQRVLESIDEFERELDLNTENIAAQALEHIHSGEVILTAGKSRTVEAFLKKASAKRTFHVIVVELAPFYTGHELARSLAKANIKTTLIPDSAVFAMMPRVNKVIIGTHSVMANGGLKAQCGVHAVALAAKHYSVPLIVCAPVFKLTPQYLCSEDQEAFNKFVSPEKVVGFETGAMLNDVELVNPVFDYVPPDLVPLFVFNIGGNAPSYVYRLLSELYHPDDYFLTAN